MRGSLRLTIEGAVFAVLTVIQFVLFEFAIEPAFPLLFPISPLLFTFSLLWVLFSLSWKNKTDNNLKTLARITVYLWCFSVPWSLWGAYRWVGLLVYVPFAGLPLALCNFPL
jgi:hypothetical protein